MATIEELKRAIQRAQQSGAGPTRRYAGDLRGRVVDWSRTKMAAGHSLREVSSALGLREGTLAHWMESKPCRVRPVTVVAAAPVESPSGTLRLITPSGCRIEGLDVTTAAALARALS